MRTVFLALAAAMVMSAGGAYAEEAKPATAATTQMVAKTPVAKKSVAERSEISKKCSADADAKKLHGKARKAFRKTCMKAPA